METEIKNLIPVIPGRGINTKMSTQMRLDYLKNLKIETDKLIESQINLNEIQKNIESFIGSVEVPLGIVGPLLYTDDNKSELVYCVAGTLEGALIASMNRGAKAISLSGGISANVHWQKMVRAPMFVFEQELDTTTFIEFVKANYTEIKNEAEKHSNHAILLEIESVQTGSAAHLKFIYTTGDASGQNMTTSCTWHAMLFIVEKFKIEKNIICHNFIIDGNGSSDKKVSSYSINSGRGMRVTANCFINEKTINEVLRTTSEKMMIYFESSKKISELNGMVGYNINVANAIAAIFLATGQDLGTLNESSTGFLNLERTTEGINFSLTLTNLLIGTVGGGTHLPKQNQALKMLNCNGTGKVNRFGKLIACFALSLDISTYASVVSGEFAKAHEKLGRNKPVNWMLRSELNQQFITRCLNGRFQNKEIQSIKVITENVLENGILTNIAGKINRKLIGFVPVKVDYINSNEQDQKSIQLLIKSKALDEEVIKGLHILGASINPELSDEIKNSKNNLEYKNCHLKEIEIVSWLNKQDYLFMPTYYGKWIDQERDIYLFIQESLDYSKLSIINSENKPEIWEQNDILKVIEVITLVHRSTNAKTINESIKHVSEFEAWRSEALYTKMTSILINEEYDTVKKEKLNKLFGFISNLKSDSEALCIEKCLVHNDFNSRNIAIRENGNPVIYDWELAVINIPHRDIVEFLSFVLLEDFKREELYFYLDFHFKLHHTKQASLSKKDWLKGYEYALKEFLVSRVAFYEVAGILLKYEFSGRILNTCFKMLDMLETNE